MIIHIIHIEKTAPYTLKLTFDDANQAVKEVNLFSYLKGPVFEPLKDPDYFARVMLDSELGTIVWPNGADFAPDFLYKLPEQVIT